LHYDLLDVLQKDFTIYIPEIAIRKAFDGGRTRLVV